MIAAPLTGSGRIQAIDVLRGIALLGIVVVNAPFFGLPMAASMEGGINSGPLLDRLASLLVMIVAEFKFVSLFSLLFGFGLAMQRQRRLATGTGFAWFGVRRMLVLAAFGALHAVGLWFGDILFVYAGVGLLLIPLLQLGRTTRLVLGIVALAWATVALAGFNVLMLASPEAAGASIADPPLRGLDAMRAAQLDPSHPEWIDAEIAALGGGPFLDATLFRSVIWIQSIMFSILCFGWQMLGMALIGTWLHDVAAFGPEGKPLRRTLAVVALPLGVVLSVGCGVVFWNMPKNAPLGILCQSVQIAAAPLVAVGGAAFVTILVNAGRLPLASILANVGRMSLTAYLLESVVFVALMGHWGLGWFGTCSRAELLGLAIVVYATVATFCVVWSLGFRMGPIEWLWRTASYLRSPKNTTD